MVESVKKSFLNHVFLGDKNRREKVTPVFMFLLYLKRVKIMNFWEQKVGPALKKLPL